MVCNTPSSEWTLISTVGGLGNISAEVIKRMDVRVCSLRKKCGAGTLQEASLNQICESQNVLFCKESSTLQGFFCLFLLFVWPKITQSHNNKMIFKLY